MKPHVLKWVYLGIVDGMSKKNDGFPMNHCGGDLLLEHLDFCPCEEGAEPKIVYRGVLNVARMCAAENGWTFRSLSDGSIEVSHEEFSEKLRGSFPAIILYRNGIVIGRTNAIFMRPEHVKEWVVSTCALAQAAPAD